MSRKRNWLNAQFVGVYGLDVKWVKRRVSPKKDFNFLG